VFTRPDGERIPDVPRPLVLTGDPLIGDPLAVLAADQHRSDVSAETFRSDVSAETFRCRWDGKPPDYGAMVRLLDHRTSRRTSRRNA